MKTDIKFFFITMSYHKGVAVLSSLITIFSLEPGFSPAMIGICISWSFIFLRYRFVGFNLLIFFFVRLQGIPHVHIFLKIYPKIRGSI